MKYVCVNMNEICVCKYEWNMCVNMNEICV